MIAEGVEISGGERGTPAGLKEQARVTQAQSTTKHLSPLVNNQDSVESITYIPEREREIMKGQRRLGEVIEHVVQVALGPGEAFKYRSNDPEIALSPKEKQKAQQKLNANERYVMAVMDLVDFTLPHVSDVIDDYTGKVKKRSAQEIGRVALIKAAKSWLYTDHSFTEYARAVILQELRAAAGEQTEVPAPSHTYIRLKPEKEKKPRMPYQVTEENGRFVITKKDGIQVEIAKQAIEDLQMLGEGFVMKEIGGNTRKESEVKDIFAYLRKTFSRLRLEGYNCSTNYGVYAAAYDLGLLPHLVEKVNVEDIEISRPPKSATMIRVGELQLGIKHLQYFHGLLQGKSFPQIAKEFNLSSGRLTKILLKLKVKYADVHENGNQPTTFSLFAKLYQYGVLDKAKIDWLLEQEKNPAVVFSSADKLLNYLQLLALGHTVESALQELSALKSTMWNRKKKVGEMLVEQGKLSPNHLTDFVLYRAAYEIGVLDVKKDREDMDTKNMLFDIKHKRVIVNNFIVTPIQLAYLNELSKGLSIEEIAKRYKVNEDAITQRLHRAIENNNQPTTFAVYAQALRYGLLDDEVIARIKQELGLEAQTVEHKEQADIHTFQEHPTYEVAADDK